MQKIDILLINPYWSQLPESIEHMGFGYMASMLRNNGLSVAILDAPVNGWDNEATYKAASEYSPSVIGVSIPFQDGANDALSLIQKLRQKFSCHITVGGIYPTFEYEPMMKEYSEIDSIVLGEGEETIVDLVRAVEDKTPLESIDGIAYRSSDEIIKTKLRPLIEDLDILPFPARDTLPVVFKKFNFVSVVTSRGCYGRCSFCSVDGFYSAFGPKYRVRSAGNVVDEIEMLYKKYKVHNFMFNDANFIGGITSGRQRALDIANEIIKRNLKIEFRIQCRANDIDRELFKTLKDAGLTRVYVGIESGSQPQLDRYQKDITVEQNYKAMSILNELGLYAKIGFIMFDRDCTFDDLYNNITFINNLKKTYNPDRLGYIYPISKLLPLSGSRFKVDLEKSGALKGNYKNYSYEFKDRKVKMFYNFMQKSSGVIWGFKRKLKDDDVDSKDWTRGWKVWED